MSNRSLHTVEARRTQSLGWRSLHRSREKVYVLVHNDPDQFVILHSSSSLLYSVCFDNVWVLKELLVEWLSEVRRGRVLGGE